MLADLDRQIAGKLVAVAPANKMARIAWAVMTRGEAYRRKPRFKRSNRRAASACLEWVTVIDAWRGDRPQRSTPEPRVDAQGCKS